MVEKAKPKVRFILKNPKAKKRTSINMIYAWGYVEGGKYKPLKYATGQNVNPDDWTGTGAKGSFAASINNELSDIKNKADKIYNKLDKEDLTPGLIKSELDIALGRAEAPKEPVKKRVFVTDYITTYIDQIDTGARRSFKDPVKKFSRGTVRNFRAFKNKLAGYETARGKRLVFDDITMDFYRLFIVWLDKSHTVNSTGKTIKQLKMIMQAALDAKVHTNVEFKMKGFKVVTELVDTIYLDEQELAKLYAYDAKPALEKARDLFMVGCLTAQRVSDWYKVDKSNLKKTPSGVPIFRFNQQKTGTTVTIPFLNHRLIAIMEKYDYNLPKLSEQKINLYIKEVCRLAGIEEKASQVTTHTARRSGCTNMYNAGIPSGKIMKISGHKTESEFKKYIRVTDDEVADDLANYEYFNR